MSDMRCVSITDFENSGVRAVRWLKDGNGQIHVTGDGARLYSWVKLHSKRVEKMKTTLETGQKNLTKKLENQAISLFDAEVTVSLSLFSVGLWSPRGLRVLHPYECSY